MVETKQEQQTSVSVKSVSIMMVICGCNDDHDAIEHENVHSHLIPIINETGEENYVSECL